MRIGPIRAQPLENLSRLFKKYYYTTIFHTFNTDFIKAMCFRETIEKYLSYKTDVKISMSILLSRNVTKNQLHTHTHTHTQKNSATDTDALKHTQIQTLKHTNTQTHTYTHKHTRTLIYTH